MTKVAIFGGGVGGLSAAHELLELGYDVEIYERNVLWGGKARSMGKAYTGKDGNKNLPGEHGFRFFPGFYKHVTNTMERIPFPGKENGCLGNLVPTTQIAMLRDDGVPVVLPANFPKDIGEWQEAFNAAFGSHLGLRKESAEFFVQRLLRLASACEERMIHKFEKISWWDYLKVDEMNDERDAYKKMLAEGLTRSLVAMKAEMASTRTVGTMLLQMLYNMMTPGVQIDRVLNGPTNEMWIRPWVDHLKENHAKMFLRSTVKSFTMKDGRIASVTVDVDGDEREVEADHYICALPVEKLVNLLTPEMKAASKSLSQIHNLHVEWMNGIQFYLNHDVPVVHGHTIYVDSAWALTSVSQHQFWTGVELDTYGDGTVKGILSVDISDWKTNGTKVHLKPAEECTAEQIMEECWAQLMDHLDEGGRKQLEVADRVDWHLDPDIVFPRLDDRNDHNAEPLLINKADSLQYRPEAGTEIANFYLASDYVHTTTDLACMEGANEAARRAVNALLDREGSKAKRCELWPWDVPRVFRVLQKIDAARWALGHDQHTDFDNLPEEFDLEDTA